MDKNIVLFGFMGTGKTSVAESVAKRLNMTFVEMDSIIEQREGISINEIFDRKGEEYFRSTESKITAELSDKDNLVISTGGGVVLNKDNIDKFGKNGILICLDADAENIYERVKEQKHRPLLNVEEPLERIKELLSYRQPFYGRIKTHIDTNNKNIEQVTDAVEKIVEAHKE